jgi:hypothetical protein
MYSPHRRQPWASEVAVLDDLAKAQLGAWLVQERIEDRLDSANARDDARLDMHLRELGPIPVAFARPWEV